MQRVDAQHFQNVQDAIGQYNDLFDKNQNLKHEVKILQRYIRSLKEKQFNCFGDNQQHADEERNYLEDIRCLKCEIDEKEVEIIQMDRELVRKLDEYQKNLKCIFEKLHQHSEGWNKDACSNCNSKMECKLEPAPVSNTSSSKNTFLSEYATGNECERSDKFGDLEKLLRTIDIYCNLNCTCDPYRPMFERSRITICGLISEKDAQMPSSKKYEDIVLNLKVENLTMAKDMSLLAIKLEEMMSDKKVLETNIAGISHKLYAKVESESKLSKELELSKDELQNMRYALDMRIEDKSQLVRELDEKNQIIKDDVKIKDELEKQLVTIEIKLHESETLKNVCNAKLDELSITNKKFQSELEQSKADNIEKMNTIDSLQKEVDELKTVIKASEIQRKYYEEEMDNLKECCSTVERKSKEAVNELNKIIETLRDELKFAKLELNDALEHLRERDEEKESMLNQKRSLEENVENLMNELQECKALNDRLTKTNFINEQEKNSLKDEINRLTCKLHEVTTENDELNNTVVQYIKDMEVKQSTITILETINFELKNKLQLLEQNNCDLVANIDELNASLVQAKKLEISARKELIQCNQNLKIATDEIENFDLEIKGLNKKLTETCEMLTFTKKKLNDADLKVIEETRRNYQINEAYCRLINECCCGAQTRQTTECDKPEKKPVCLKCSGCQTDITGKQMSNKDLEFKDTKREYDRLVCENDTLCSIVKDLKDDVRDLRHLNRVLKESMEQQKVRACCSKSSSVHVGLQTCSASCPEMNKCECSNDHCDNPHNSYPVSVNLKTTASACSCTSDACSCSGSKNALDKICRCVDDDREKLQCRLNEMAEVCNAKEKIAQKALCEAERMLSDVETKLQQCRVQSQNQIGKLSGKLAECEMTIRCKEKELDGCRLRESQLLRELEGLNVQIQCKDQQLESDKIKCASLCNTVQEYKKQLNCLRDALEVEQSTKNDLDKQIRAYSEMCTIQSKQVTDLENRLGALSQSPKASKKRPSSTALLQRSLEKRMSSGKRPKAGADSKRSSKTIKWKLPYIACCVGLADPCNRLKMWEASQSRVASSSRNGKGVHKGTAVTQPKKSPTVVDPSSSVVVGSSRYERLMFGELRSSAFGTRPEIEKQSCLILKKTTDATRRKTGE